MINQFDEIKQNLSTEEIIEIVTQILGAHTYIERDEHIVFPTICHNIESENAKLKMYYYKESQLFHCYTECGDSFDIFDLFKRYYIIRNKEFNFYTDILYKIIDKNTIILGKENFIYKPQRDRYYKKNKNVKLPIYPYQILNIFNKQYPVEWTYENISDITMERFGIRFSILDNKIIIPHYDILGNLVGIRGRALNQYDINNFGKYAPVLIQGKWYSHPLSLNLYGINLNKETIKKMKRIILYEGEKSVLLHEQYFGKDENNSLAVCGSSFNKLQLKLLISNFYLEEITIAFDKEFSTYPSKQADNYYKKMKELCSKYKQYCNFSFIYDTGNLLKEKQSPIDAGKIIFEKLYIDRIQVK